MTRMEKQKNISELIVVFVIYFFVLVAAGIYKIHLISGFLDQELIVSTKISGYTSLLVSSIVSILVMAIIDSMIIAINKLFDFYIDEDFLITSFKSIVYVFIFFELIKFVFTIFTIEQELVNLNGDNDFTDQLKSTSWFYTQTLMNFSSLVVGAFAFGLTLYKLKATGNFRTLFLLCGTLLLLFYASTIEIFSIN